MVHDANSLLKTTLELEGLLLIEIERGDAAPAVIRALIAEKIAAIAAYANAPAPTATPEPIATPAPEPIAAPATEPIVTPAPEPKPEPVAAPTPAAETVADTIDTPEKLEDRLARANARDIFKAFTLNDKFRFRRELFRNSQADFDDTLDIIASMGSFEEAEEYFYDDLCWDAENDDVRHFMEIVAKHF